MSGPPLGPWASKNEALLVHADAEQPWNMAIVQGEASSSDLVAMAWGFSPEGVARRASLIAAAPKLYAKLNLAATIFEEYARQHRAKSTTAGDLKAQRNEQYAAEMRAVLAEARGESQ